MSEQKSSKKTILIVSCVLVVLIAAAAIIYAVTRPATHQGAKTVTVKVITGDTEADTKTFTLHTDQEFLRGALEEQKLIKGSESEYGMFVTEVNGVKADDTKQQWWCFTKGGETLMTGVDTTPIADGDVFEITLTTGW